MTAQNGTRAPERSADRPAAAGAKPTMALSARGWGVLIALSVLWGGSFFFVEVAITGLPPLTVVALRVGLAAAVLWGIVAAFGRLVPRRLSIWAAFLAMGLLNNVIPFSLIVWGQTHITSGLASIFNATTPLFTVLVAGTLLTDERPSAMKLGGVAVGFGGVVVMIGPGVLMDLDVTGGGWILLAQAAVLAAALSYAFAGVFGRRFRAMGIDPIVTAAGQVTGSSLVMFPLALLVDRPWTLVAPAGEVWAAVIGLAVLATAVAYILYFHLLAVAGAVNLLLVTFLIPVSAILLGVGILGEPITGPELIGMGLIGAGLSLIDGRLWRRT